MASNRTVPEITAAFVTFARQLLFFIDCSGSAEVPAAAKEAVAEEAAAIEATAKEAIASNIVVLEGQTTKSGSAPVFILL